MDRSAGRAIVAIVVAALLFGAGAGAPALVFADELQSTPTPIAAAGETPSSVAENTEADDAETQVLADIAARHALSIDEARHAYEIMAAGASSVEAVRAEPDQFGGIYFDWESQAPGFVVLYTGNVAPDPLPGVSRFLRVKHSYAELSLIRDEIAANALKDPAGSGLLRLSIDERRNAVVLSVTQPDAPVAKAASSFGDAAETVVGVSEVAAACTSRTSCVPYRGGISIDGPLSCTYGFNGYRNGYGDVVVIAGHCDWYLSNSWYHHHGQGGSEFVGTSTKNGLWNGNDVDALRLDAYATTGPFNRIYHTNVEKSIQVKGVVSNSAFFVGQPVSRVGRNTQATGEIDGGIMLYIMDIAGGPKFAWGWPTTTTAVGGDSGGPFYWWDPSQTRYELVGFCSTVDGIFASQEDAKRVLNLTRFCTTDSCF